MFIKKILTFIGLAFGTLLGFSILVTLKVLTAEIAAILWVVCVLISIGVAIAMKPKSKKSKKSEDD